MTNKIKTYSELIKHKTFEERFNYLKENLRGHVGEDTFGHARYLNQRFYQSTEWKSVRNRIILRDGGCDLGSPDREIQGPIYIHHMNVLSKEDFLEQTDLLRNPEYLICCDYRTHSALHYGDISLLATAPIERRQGDTCLWRTE